MLQRLVDELLLNVFDEALDTDAREEMRYASPHGAAADHGGLFYLHHTKPP
jgi:hypothetical protein